MNNVQLNVKEKMKKNYIDIHIGSRIRIKRKALGYSQEALAIDLGVSFQQVQKYESGGNRVSASRIYEIAKILKTYPSFFFEGISDSDDNNLALDVRTVKIVDKFNNIKSKKIKDRIFDLICDLD